MAMMTTAHIDSSTKSSWNKIPVEYVKYRNMTNSILSGNIDARKSETTESRSRYAKGEAPPN